MTNLRAASLLVVVLHWQALSSFPSYKHVRTQFSQPARIKGINYKCLKKLITNYHSAKMSFRTFTLAQRRKIRLCTDIVSRLPIVLYQISDFESKYFSKI